MFLNLFCFVWVFSVCKVNAQSKGANVVYAVNCGGDEHVGIDGVVYKADPSITGTASAHGRGMRILRVPEPDQPLYQTERYHTDTFGYDIPIFEDGSYVLVLKFSEVWFAVSNMKVFSVVLNKRHRVISDLDIFAKVGRGVAHDEVISFTLKDGVMKIGGETSKVKKSFRLDLEKGNKDNPKINAFYLMKGTAKDVEAMPPVPGLHEEDSDEDEESEEPVPRQEQPQRKYKRSDSRVEDPYENEDSSSLMLPFLIAVGVAVPLGFCLCRL